jgi:hypothetical protein
MAICMIIDLGHTYDEHLVLILKSGVTLNKSIMNLSPIILGDLVTLKIGCFNFNISNKDLADSAYSRLSPLLKEKLESHAFSVVSQVLQRVLDCES